MSQPTDPTGPGRTLDLVAEAPEVPGYLIGERLGTGGMGAVFRARELATARDVAIKFLTRDAPPDLQERFEREARAAASLRHPNVVTVFSAGRAKTGELFIVLELVEGFALKTALDTRALGPLALASLGAKVAHALEAAHERGIIHRDIKPANILVDALGEPRVVDFGLARLERDAGRRLTIPGVAFGTLLYMAPETLDQGASAAGAPADVFALGCILHEGLSGSPPFGVDARETVSRLMSGRCEPLPATVAPALKAIVERTLARDPAARPKAGELAAALEAFAREASPEPPRRSALAIALALFFVIASLGGVAIWWYETHRYATQEELETSIAVVQQSIDQGQGEKAIAVATEALARAPEAATAERAKLLAARGRTRLLPFDARAREAARADLDLAVSLDPKNLTAHFASFAEAIGGGDRARAQTLSDKIAELAPKSTEDKLARGYLRIVADPTLANRPWVKFFEKELENSFRDKVLIDALHGQLGKHP